MCDELIIALRTCVDKDKDCFECPYYERCMNNTSGKLVPMVDAADAIEELSREVDIDNDAMTAMYASMPRWIPVTERLPKTRKSILGKRSSKVIVAFRFDDGTQGTDTAHTLNGEWVFEDHITVVARTITHWMQLPKPPKEET